MTDGGRRMATATGAMLADPACLGNPPQITAQTAQSLFDPVALFDPEFWRARGELRDVTGGRGAAWFIESDSRRWALRHYRRGGFIAHFSQDRYLWMGEDRVRAFAEWRLLDELCRLGLPVPKPVAARYERLGWSYRCDLITQRIVGAAPLSAVLARDSLPEPQWRAIGAAIARLHRAGVDHADLNAHNILIDAAGLVSVIDFDRGRLRGPRAHGGPGGPGGQRSQRGQHAWAARNMQRLHRSLVKISRGLEAGRFSTSAWDWLLAGYEAA